MWLTRIAISRPIVIWTALAAIAILGLIAYSRLPAELNPQVAIPTLTVTTVYPGAGPQEIESLVTKPIEDAVGSVSGIKDVFSTSQDSVSIVSIDFVIGTDLARAANSMREKVEAARSLLPPDARAPIVQRLDINAQPVLYIALASSVPSRELRERVDTLLKPRIARIPGVAAVNVAGGATREVQVRVDATRLEQYGFTIEDVVNAVQSANRNVPAGSIVEGRRDIGVRSLGAFSRPEDIEDAEILAPSVMRAGGNDARMAPPAPNSGGAFTPVTVGDVASVVDTAARPTTVTRVNGRDSVGIVVTKASSANTVEVVQGVRDVIDSQRNALPDTQIYYVRDDSVMVRDALDDVDTTLVLGAILATTVVFLFLHNLRGTLIVALALPACLVATFLTMYFAGFTLNQMTLLALSLSVGILIDDSIVVLESITRHLGLGEEPAEAAFNGRTEIGFADITTTLVDVVVFLPIAFMGGIVGAFFRQFGLTVVVATLFSLVVSFTVTPSLAARWYRQGEDPEREARSRGGMETAYLFVERFYRRVLRHAMRNRWWVLATGAVALAAVLLVATPNLGVELLPATDQGQVSISVELPPDSSLEATDAATRGVEKRLVGTPDVSAYVSTVGEVLGGFGAFPQQGPQYAQLNVRLAEKEGLLDRLAHLGLPSGLRTRSDEAVAEDIRRRLRGVPGAHIVVSTVRTVADTGPPIQVQLRGANLDDLASVAAQLRDRLAQMPGILDPDVSLRTGKPEVQVHIDRSRAAALSISPAQAGAILRDAIEGNTDSVLRVSGTETPIRVQLAGVNRSRPEDLRRIVVGASGGRPVTLGEVADLQMGAGPTAIDRVNGQRMVTVSAGLAPGYVFSNAQRDIEEQMADITQSGIQVHWSGEAETFSENAAYFALAVGLAVILVYLVMASLFNSLLNPFIIMFTLPMALIGALGALAVTGSTVSLVSMIGIVMLTGLMGRNAILLIDYTGTLRARGMPRLEAVEEAGATRLRPILMTTLATVFGMLPVALRIGRASELRAPMAIVVIGGLLLSTVLTLVVIPVLYTLFDDWRTRRQAAGAGRQSTGDRVRKRV